jgi:chitin disaccharide deacetylase
MRHLIINADGYGFTAGITRAIEECIVFGTVRSISVNINFKHADRLAKLVRANPDISVGCHINPVVGSPVLAPEKIPTLVNETGEFFYREFARRFVKGQIRIPELQNEMIAQVERTYELAGSAFSHIDFHMGLHKLPRLYGAFLEVVQRSKVGRIRSYRYRVGMESRLPTLRHFVYMLGGASRIPKYVWNQWQRRKALRRQLATPDHWVVITNLGFRTNTIALPNYLRMLRNLPEGFNEFVVHPGYVDEELKRWSSYIEQRPLEMKVLLDTHFREALNLSDVHLAGYRDIPLRQL